MTSLNVGRKRVAQCVSAVVDIDRVVTFVREFDDDVGGRRRGLALHARQARQDREAARGRRRPGARVRRRARAR